MRRVLLLLLVVAGCGGLAAAELPGLPAAQAVATPTADDRALAARVRVLAEAAAVSDVPAREPANYLLGGASSCFRQLAGEQPATGKELENARALLRDSSATLEGDWPRPKSVVIPRATGSVTVDGLLDDLAWRHAWTSSELYSFNRRERTEIPATRWQMMWDDRYLYVAYDCEDLKLSAPDYPRDGPVYKDDCVELFLRTAAEPVRYWEIVVGPRGSLFDAFHVKRMNGWGPEPGGPAATLEGLRYATRQRPGGYTVEMAVPFAALPDYADGRAPKEGEGLLGMLVRLDKTASDLRAYAAVPLLAWGHNVWNHIPFTLGPTSASPETVTSELEIQQMQQWWDCNQQSFVYIGVAVGTCLVAWLLFSLVRWSREEKDATFKCGTLLYSKKGLMLIFAWLLWGDFCFTLMETIAGSVMPWKFKSLNASGTTTSLIMTSLPAVFNFFITPSVSIWSDRIRTRWGRRIPFILTTMPFLTASLVMIAYSDNIALWLNHMLSSGSPFDQAKVAVMVLAVCAGVFDLFNMFVNTVYWYLFNDVVPQEMMGRFMAYFRLVSTITGALYNFFLFKYAVSHMKELYLLAAGVYIVGFGVMCLRVKESDYPPPEDAGPKTTFREKVRHVVESLSISQYLYWTMANSFSVLGGCMSVFSAFLMLSLLMTMSNIGILNGITAIISPIFLLFVGGLVDRWHPVRVYYYTIQYGAIFCLGGWIWWFVDHPSPIVFMLSAVIAGLFSAPMGAIGGVAGLPAVFALLPREKFGQYNGAMCMVRAVAAMLGGVLAGLFIDIVRKVVPEHGDDPNWVYRYGFLFSAFFTILASYYWYKVYRGWKRLGGEKSYVPPVHRFRLRDLPPHPDVDGKVNWKLMSFAGIYMIGTILCTVVWVSYYVWWQPNARYALLFAISGLTTVGLNLLYLRFIKFSERQ